ncbi:WD40-repeat-containing domain [Pseudocohnilembus persalinus]|uniref:WD40-repeat-containing domain n=1 Tax=Pseudocohnilembus persalinus TaxID=266149 RepID=A0A0V0QJI6_PSEPJ|nr:WD40-repeat-containing domain [Pseudocohnilembus persalinus]|eukprot:KRX02445.1 WD40-repeat-containing domain [Pseudocohnilembus persalinus]
MFNRRSTIQKVKENEKNLWEKIEENLEYAKMSFQQQIEFKIAHIEELKYKNTENQLSHNQDLKNRYGVDEEFNDKIDQNKREQKLQNQKLFENQQLLKQQLKNHEVFTKDRRLAIQFKHPQHLLGQISIHKKQVKQIGFVEHKKDQMQLYTVDQGGNMYIHDLYDLYKNPIRKKILNNIIGINLSYDYKYLVSGGMNDMIEIFSIGLQTVTERGLVEGWVNNISISLNNKWIAYSTLESSHDKYYKNKYDICLHKVGQLHLEPVYLKHHQSQIQQLIFSKCDENRLVTSCQNNEIVIWDVENQQNIVYKELQDIHYVSLSNDGNIIFTSNYVGDITALQIDYNEIKEIQKIYVAHDKAVNIIVPYQNDGFVTAGYDKQIKIWKKNYNEYEVVQYIDYAHDQNIEILASDEEGQFLVSGDQYKHVLKVWSIEEITQ